MALNFLSISDGIKTPSHATDPSGGIAGDMYFNSTTSSLRIHNGVIWVDVGGGGGAGIPEPTTYLTGGSSGNYPVPADTMYLRVRLWAAGGGGAGGATYSTTGGTGGNTTFDSFVTAYGGAGGGYYGGGAGGGVSLGSPAVPLIKVAGGAGGGSNGTGGSPYQMPMSGGNNPLGGAGGSGSAPGVPNSGGGGAGGGVGPTGLTGGSGGAGGYAEFILTGPFPASYPWTVGAGGAGAVGDISTGSPGGSGQILIEAYKSTSPTPVTPGTNIAILHSNLPTNSTYIVRGTAIGGTAPTPGGSTPTNTPLTAMFTPGTYTAPIQAGFTGIISGTSIFASATLDSSTGISPSVVITANTAGTIGNSIVLVFDGSTDIATVWQHGTVPIFPTKQQLLVDLIHKYQQPIQLRLDSLPQVISLHQE
jgi:hypothetical protein